MGSSEQYIQYFHMRAGNTYQGIRDLPHMPTCSTNVNANVRLVFVDTTLDETLIHRFHDSKQGNIFRSFYFEVTPNWFCRENSLNWETELYLMNKFF